MKYLSQFLIILGFSLMGELLNWLLPLPIPASIYGLLLLFIALISKLLPLKSIDTIGDFLVSILPILLISPAVNLIDYMDIIAANLVPIFILIAGTTIVTFILSGCITKWITKLYRGGVIKNDKYTRK